MKLKLRQKIYMKRILIFLIVLNSQMTFSQDFNLIKSWIMVEAVDCSGKLLDSSEETYWNIIFKQNGSATIIIDQNLRTEKSFKVNGQFIELPTVSYEISKISTDSLILSDRNGRCVNYLFLSEVANDQRKSEILEEKKYKYFMYDGDTVYFANNVNTPKMKKYNNYFEYFIRAFPNMGNTLDCVVQFQFIVNKQGEITSPKGSISCLKDDSKTVNKIIEGMNGEWEPMILDGKPVNALVRVKFTHGIVDIIKQ